MSRIGLPWRGALQNTSQYGEWYGSKKVKGLNIIAKITMAGKGRYHWEIDSNIGVLAKGDETANTGGLPAAKEAVSIALTDWAETYKG